MPVGRGPTVSGVTTSTPGPHPLSTAPRSPGRPPAHSPGSSRASRSAVRVGGITLADRRGLSATGAVLGAFVLGLAGGILDIVVSPGLGLGFALAFVAGCLLAVLLVHREDLLAIVLMPPLLYLALVLVSTAVVPVQGNGGEANQLLVELVNAVVVSAPVMFLATGGAFLVAFLRGWRRRSARRRLTRPVGPLS